MPSLVREGSCLCTSYECATPWQKQSPLGEGKGRAVRNKLLASEQLLLSIVQRQVNNMDGAALMRTGWR